MTEPLPANQRSLRSEQIRRQIAQFRSSRSQGIFGVAELLGMFISLLMLLVVLVSYFNFLVPARSQLDSQQRERARLQTLLRTSTEVMRKEQNTNEIVERITSSMEEFEMGRLAHSAQGRMDLYEELNELIKKNALRNTSGPTYTVLETVGSKAANRTASAKWQSVYPGIAVALTVEGQYQSLRRFVQDIETSKQFIIINAVELERATEANSPVAADSAITGSRGALVSLRVDLATYFQRNLAGEPDVVNAAQK